MKDAAATMLFATSQKSLADTSNTAAPRIDGSCQIQLSIARFRKSLRRDKMENKLQYRSNSFDFETREDGENPVIEGYFSVFNTNYDM